MANDKVRHRLQDTYGKKDRKIIYYSMLDRIMSNDLWNFLYPLLFQDNLDLLVKKRRNRFVILLQYHKEQEKKLISCLGISIENTLYGRFCVEILFLLISRFRGLVYRHYFCKPIK